jgi:hypothetical protein
MTSDNEPTTNHQQAYRSLPATEAQLQYLQYLLARAQALGVPYLTAEALSRRAVSTWIDYLKSVMGEEKEGTTPSSSSGGAV